MIPGNIKLLVSIVIPCKWPVSQLFGTLIDCCRMLSRDALPMDIGAKYFDGNSCLLLKAPQVFGRKTRGG